jgi:hypothetical protein
MARPAHRQPPTRPTRAVCYLRVSTDEQAGSGLGLEAQEAAVRSWAAYRGVEVVVEVDVGSGAMLPTDRPGFGRSLARLERGQADCLVAAKLDRVTPQLARPGRRARPRPRTRLRPRAARPPKWTRPRRPAGSWLASWPRSRPSSAS